MGKLWEFLKQKIKQVCAIRFCNSVDSFGFFVPLPDGRFPMPKVHFLVVRFFVGVVSFGLGSAFATNASCVLYR